LERRSFLSHAGAAGIGTALLAAPAVSRAQPAVRWRCQSGVPRTLDILFDTNEEIARRVSEATGGRFNITIAPAGEIVPTAQAADAVIAGTIQSALVSTFWYTGKDPVWAFGTTIPFGMNVRQHNAWWKDGGGERMFNDWLQQRGARFVLAGHTGVQMAGWFRRELRSPADVNGLRIRVSGLAGNVWLGAGAVPQQIAAGDIFPALERGTIDAAEWIGPHDDEKLGFQRVARFYYYPGFAEGTGSPGWLINNRAWDALPAEYRSIFNAAAGEAITTTMARYDARNEPALRRLIAGGTQLREFPRPIMESFWDRAQAMYAEIGRTNAEFKRFHDHYTSFQRDAVGWSRIQENSFDDMIAHLLRRRPAAGAAQRRPG